MNSWIPASPLEQNGSGNKVWDKSYGGSDTDSLQSLQPTSDGGYILGGYSYPGVSSNKSTGNYGGVDYWIVKLAPEPPFISSITAMHGV